MEALPSTPAHTPTSSKTSTVESGQKTLDSFGSKNDVTKAEIIWLPKTVDSGFSVRSNDEINCLQSCFQTVL